MRKILLVLLFLPALSFAQTPHVTNPFTYLWDYPTENVNGTTGVSQVNHFELQIDAGPILASAVPSAISSTISATPCTIGGVTTPCTTFKVPSSAISLSTLGAHTFTIRACLDATSGACVASGPFAFALDPKPLPSAQRLGVGI